MNTNTTQIVKIAINHKTGTRASLQFASQIWNEDKYGIHEIKARVNAKGRIEFTASNEPDSSDFRFEVAFARGRGYGYRSADEITRRHKLYNQLNLSI